MSAPEAAPPVDHFTRQEVNVAAARLAANIHRFIDDAGQYVSLARKYNLTSAAMVLEELANGR